MFSFVPEDRSIPIAKVVGGPLDGIRVWQREEDPEAPLAENSCKCECGKTFETPKSCMKHRNSTCSYMKKLRKMIESDTVPDIPFSDVTLVDGTFQVLPYQVSMEDGTPCFTQRIYVAGQSGCGKSRWAGNWLREYQERYPEKEIIAICHTDMGSDPAYSGVDVEQLDLDDEEFIELCREQVLAGGLIQDQICLFDDIDKLEGPAKETANRLLGQTIMMGRKQGIPVCFCNHLGADRHATRDILNGATAIVVFPRGGSPGQLDYLLKKHVGLSNIGARGLMEDRPRWAYVHRNYPSYVMTEKRLCSMEELDNVQKEKEREARRPKPTTWAEIRGYPLDPKEEALLKRMRRRQVESQQKYVC